MQSVAPLSTVSLKCHLTPEYREILAILMQREHYRSATEVLESFLGHWALSPQRHRLTGRHAAEKGFSREQRGRQLRDLLCSGRSMEGRWLIRRIHDAISLLTPVGPLTAEEPARPVNCDAPARHPSVNVKISPAHLQILRRMQISEGYRSPTEALESFLAHWALAPFPHKLTGKWAAARGAVREERGRQLLRQLESGEKMKGSWLNARIYDAIKAALGAEAKSPTIKEVAAILPDVVDSTLAKEFG